MDNIISALSKEALLTAREAIEDKINSLIDVRNQIDAALGKNTYVPKKIVKKGVVYNAEWSWIKKAVYFLNKKKVAMTLNDILTSAGSIEELPEDPTDYAKLRSNLAQQLKQNLDKTFKRVKLGNNIDAKYYYYGLLEWFNEDGDLEREYAP